MLFAIYECHLPERDISLLNGGEPTYACRQRCECMELQSLGPITLGLKLILSLKHKIKLDLFTLFQAQFKLNFKLICIQA